MLAAGLLMAGLAGCAPSLRMMHRSRAYFERCYAADFDARVVPTERRACWDAWLAHYTQGQPRERVQYARARLRTDGAPAEPLFATDALASAAEASPAASSPDSATPTTPRDEGATGCAAVCGPRFASCAARCDDADPAPCRAACDAEHRACTNACP